MFTLLCPAIRLFNQFESQTLNSLNSWLKNKRGKNLSPTKIWTSVSYNQNLNSSSLEPKSSVLPISYTDHNLIGKNLVNNFGFSANMVLVKILR